MSTPIPSPELPGFDLRRRDAEWIDRPATLDEFARPLALADPHADAAELLITDMLAESHHELRALLAGRVVVRCERPSYGIPLGARDLDRPELDDWRIRELLEVELLEADPDGGVGRRVAAQFRRGLLALAGALPLLASPTLAHAYAPELPALDRVLPSTTAPADPSEPGPAVQRPTSASASPSEAPAAPATPADSAAPELPTDPPTPAEAPAAAEPAPTANAAPSSTEAPPVSPAPPAPTAPELEDLSATGTSLWIGLLDKPITLALRDGRSVEGILVGQSNTELGLRREDESLVAVAKHEIVGVRQTDIPTDERRIAQRLTVGGAAMVSVGALAIIGGTVLTAYYPPLASFAAPMLIGPGVALISGGAVMLVRGKQRKRALAQPWTGPETSRVQLTPTLAAGRTGGQAGLVLRF